MFKEFLGQEKARSIVSNLIKSRRFPHSLLFYGPRGVGKYSLAKSIVRYFNCSHTDPERKGRDNCETCMQIDNEVYPDLYIIRTEKTITKSGVEKDSKEIKKAQIKQVIKHMHYKPFKGDNKFFIIDEAESMSDISENAFLKTLEEPLPNNYIILISHNINRILGTILSRCIKIKFEPLKENVLLKIIKDKYKMNDEMALKISLLSHGSMFYANLLIENDMYKKVFEILEHVTETIQSQPFDIEALIKVSQTIKNLEIRYIDYLLDILLLFLNESYLRSFYNIKTLEVFENCLNFQKKNIKLKSYNTIVNEVIRSKYYLFNTNVDVKLLIENLIVRIKEELL